MVVLPQSDLQPEVLGQVLPVVFLITNGPGQSRYRDKSATIMPNTASRFLATPPASRTAKCRQSRRLVPQRARVRVAMANPAPCGCVTLA